VTAVTAGQAGAGLFFGWKVGTRGACAVPGPGPIGWRGCEMSQERRGNRVGEGVEVAVKTTLKG